MRPPDSALAAAVTRHNPGKYVSPSSGSGRVEKDVEIFVAVLAHPIRGHRFHVVDESGRELPERRQGRLQFTGPSATAGYHDNPRATRDLFDGDWLETSDLAYVAGGGVYLTGRIKDVVIRGGRNIHPHELEAAIGDLPGTFHMIRRAVNMLVPSSAPAGFDTRCATVRVPARMRGRPRIGRPRDRPCRDRPDRLRTGSPPSLPPRSIRPTVRCLPRSPRFSGPGLLGVVRRVDAVVNLDSGVCPGELSCDDIVGEREEPQRLGSRRRRAPKSGTALATSRNSCARPGRWSMRKPLPHSSQ